MATQKPGEWATGLLARFEDQVSVFYNVFPMLRRDTRWA